MQAGAFDPEQRYQSIQDFRTAVKNDSLGPSYVSELSDFTELDDSPPNRPGKPQLTNTKMTLFHGINIFPALEQGHLGK